MTNKQLNQEFKDMMGAAAKMAFITAVRRNGEATLAEVAAMAESEGLGHLTVGETFFDNVEFSPTRALPSSSKFSVKAKGSAVGAQAADTRTVSSRADYEKRLLEAMNGQGRWVSAQDLRTKIGGTPLQARKALNRLIEQDLIKFKGKARATKYRPRKKVKGA